MTTKIIGSNSMYSRLVAGATLALGLLVGQGTAQAEDIDLFVQPAGASGSTPNVLILLDNTANWNTASPMKSLRSFRR
jgi:hypothetical protein